LSAERGVAPPLEDTRRKEATMHFEIFADHMTVPIELRLYAESRVGLALHRAADRLSFVGVRLGREHAHAVDSPVRCQVEAWMRGLGIVTASHADADSYVAIDRAAVLLEQAVLRRLPEAETTEADEEELYVPLTSD
jgi:ribosome-associated translation inhibitor RaiA